MLPLPTLCRSGPPIALETSIPVEIDPSRYAITAIARYAKTSIGYLSSFVFSRRMKRIGVPVKSNVLRK